MATSATVIITPEDGWVQITAATGKGLLHSVGSTVCYFAESTSAPTVGGHPLTPNTAFPKESTENVWVKAGLGNARIIFTPA